MSALEKESAKNINVKAYLDAVKSYQLNQRKRKIKKRDRKQKIELDYVIQKIEEKRNCYYILKKFGLSASESEIKKVFERLLLETREDRLIRYLWIFKYRRLPRLDELVFEMARSNNELIQSTAISALSNHKDDSLRDLAIELIQQQPKSISNRLLKLFVKNYKSGDFKIIESVLSVELDIDSRHYIGMDLIEIINRQKNLELINCILWAYENTPCAYCRHKILESLIDLQQNTSSIIKECSYDCSPEIRSLISSYELKSKKS